jgi:hypothetical protein
MKTHEVLCVVKTHNGAITKESMAVAREKLIEVLDYSEGKLLAELGKKRAVPGDVIAFKLELELKFGVVDLQGKGKLNGCE